MPNKLPSSTKAQTGRKSPAKPAANFAKAMVQWQRQHGRMDLPWQLENNPYNTPYNTWLSEIMLQQTQVKTVIPYYQRFVAQYPNVNALAKASVDEVLHLWTGLGYYSRARNLHKCAQIISRQYKGKFPQTMEQLEALPGIGRSTAGAILSLSMGISAPILDGNVKRVFCRFHAIDGWSGESKTQKQLWQLAQNCVQALPPKQAGTFNQAMMDLGSGICKRSKPLCQLCPLAPACVAYQNNSQKLYPKSKPKKGIPEKEVFMLLLQKADGSVFLEQRPPQGIWGGLWSLPEFSSAQSLKKYCKTIKGASNPEKLENIKHTFSHFKLHIHPMHCHIQHEPAKISQRQNLWYAIRNKKQPAVGLASPVKKLIEQVSKQ